MTREEYLRALIKEKGYTVKSFAKSINIPYNTLLSMLNGSIGGAAVDSAIKICQALDIPTDALKEKEITEEVILKYNNSIVLNNIMNIEHKRLPMLGKIACGKPIMADEVFDGYVNVGSQIHADFCLRAVGDSMIGARIYDGDIVFIRQQPEVENGEIAAVAIDDSVTLKRVYVSEDYIELIAENPKFKPLRIRKEDAENIKILGKAVAFQGDVI